jgi:hypothetical protein
MQNVDARGGIRTTTISTLILGLKALTNAHSVFQLKQSYAPILIPIVWGLKIVSGGVHCEPPEKAVHFGEQGTPFLSTEIHNGQLTNDLC